MSKKASVSIETIKAILSKGVIPTILNYHEMLENLDALIKTTGASVVEVCEVTGLSESQYHRRRNNPELWQKNELLKLSKKYFKIKN